MCSFDAETVFFVCITTPGVLVNLNGSRAVSQVYRFGRADLTGSGVGEEEPEGGGDYLEWGPQPGSFPRQATYCQSTSSVQVSLCFNKRYLSLDHWGNVQKTILRIFQTGEEHFWLRVNHSPPRGTIILNRGPLWSGGLGDYRYFERD